MKNYSYILGAVLGVFAGWQWRGHKDNRATVGSEAAAPHVAPNLFAEQTSPPLFRTEDYFVTDDPYGLKLLRRAPEPEFMTCVDKGQPVNCRDWLTDDGRIRLTSPPLAPPPPAPKP